MRLSAFFFEIIPISFFFIGSQYFNLIIAATISIIKSIIVIITFYILEKRFSNFQFFSISLSILLTLIAYFLNDENFIKIQPTVFNGFFSSVLLIGLFYKKAMMKKFFGTQFFLTNETWVKLSLRWGIFFLFLSITNEFAWRNLSTENWVFVKVFFLMPLVGIFMLAQLPLTLKGSIKNK